MKYRMLIQIGSLSISVLLTAFLLFAGCESQNNTAPQDERNLSDAESPPPRGGAPAVWLPNEEGMLFFGGMSPITDDTWQFNARDDIWTQLDPAGDTPGNRCHHTLVADRSADNILMFGGFTDNSGRFNDTWRFDNDANEWNKLEFRGELPDRRCLQSSAYIESTNTMLIYGGIAGGGTVSGDFFSDTWLMNVEEKEWREIKTSQNPGKRSGAVIFYASEENAVYLWGGKEVDSYPDELWKFDVANNTWRQVETSGDNPVGREDPVTFWDDEAEILYMALGANQNTSDGQPSDAFELDIANKKWTELEDQQLPDDRWRPSLAFDPETKTGYMFGGWVGFNQENLNDTWKYDMQAREWQQIK